MKACEVAIGSCADTVVRSQESAEMARLYGGVTVSIVRITPEVAADMLRRNTKNRRPNQRTVDRYSISMTAHEWWMNGEPIIFSAEGELLNGQHRLLACVRSGVAFDALVVRGIEPDAFKTMDNVRPRSSADGLGIIGEVNCRSLAAAVQALITFVGLDGGMDSSGDIGARRATVLKCEQILEAHPALRDSVAAMKSCKLYRSKHAALLHYLFSLVSQRLADEFASVMHDGADDRFRPFGLFRESLIRVALRSENRRAIAAKAIKAFNAELTEARPKLLRWSPEEAFPVIQGLDYESLKRGVM